MQRLAPMLGLLAFACLAILPWGASARAADVAASGPAVLRESPEPLARILAVVPSSSFLFAHESQDSWVRVTTRDGRSGWVPGRVEGGQLLTDERQAVGTGELPGALRLGAETVLRAAPTAGSSPRSTVPPGSVVRVGSRLGDWINVTWDGGSGGWLDVVVSPVSVATDAAGKAPPPFDSAPVERPPVSARSVPPQAAESRPEPDGDSSRAAREESRAEREEAARAEREAARVQREAARAEAAAQKEQRAAEARAVREAQEAERQARREESAPAEAERPAQADSEVAEAKPRRVKEPKTPKRETPAPDADDADDVGAGAGAGDAAQRQAEQAAKREAAAQREAAEAARKAEEEAARAARLEQAAARKAEEEAERAEREAARKSAEEAARVAKAEEAAERAEREAARKSAEEAARVAKAEAKAVEEPTRAETERMARERRMEELRLAEEAAKARGPAQPVDIPPPVVVAINPKAPSERKRDPASNPLVQQGVPVVGGELAPAPALPGGAERFDEQRQLERSVAALHDDRGEALGLSTGEATPGRSATVYVGEDARPVATSVISQIVVRVNDEILTNADFERHLGEKIDEYRRRTGAALGPADEAQIRRVLLTKFIDQLVLLEEGKILGVPFDRVYEGAKARFMKQVGINDDLELVQILEATGRTWDDFRRDLLRESVPPVVLESQVYRDITVSESDIESHYRMRQEEWAEEGCVRIREIVLQPEPKERTRDFNVRLEALLKSIEGGADFCEMARRHSKAPSADDCGLLPNCFTRSQLDERVALVAFRMAPGDVEPITTDWGFHVIRLEESKARRVRDLAEVRDQIVARLRSERGAEEQRRYVDRLRESAKVDVAPEYRALLEGSARMGSAGQ